MKIVILGGSGFIGRHLCHSLAEDAHSVTVLSRNAEKASTRLDPRVAAEKWDPLEWGTLEKVIDGKDVIVNLAGEPIADSRWTESRKKALRDSRVHITHLMVNALSHVKQSPNVLINASGIGFYGPTSTTPVNEDTPAGRGFLAELCVDWEKEAARAERLGVRVVCLRIGMVLGHDGGALPKMILPFRLFAGGPILPATQPVSWIHWKDLVSLIRFILDHDRIAGPINAVSPEPVTMKAFCQALGESLNRPSWVPVPGFLLKIGLGEMATLMTTGQAVEPGVAKKFGFTFSYPTLGPALQSVVKG